MSQQQSFIAHIQSIDGCYFEKSLLGSLRFQFISIFVSFTRTIWNLWKWFVFFCDIFFQAPTFAVSPRSANVCWFQFHLVAHFHLCSSVFHFQFDWFWNMCNMASGECMKLKNYKWKKNDLRAFHRQSIVSTVYAKSGCINLMLHFVTKQKWKCVYCRWHIAGWINF